MMPDSFTDTLMPVKDGLVGARSTLDLTQWDSKFAVAIGFWNGELEAVLDPSRTREWLELIPSATLSAFRQNVKSLAQASRQYLAGARAFKEFPPTGFQEADAANRLRDERTQLVTEVLARVVRVLELAVEAPTLYIAGIAAVGGDAAQRE